MLIIKIHFNFPVILMLPKNIEILVYPMEVHHRMLGTQLTKM